MRFTLNLPFLALAVLSISQAAPLSRRHQTLTLPLTRIHDQGDTHPEIYLQQHINRGHCRLARISGSEAPTEKEMANKIRKRMDDVSSVRKRYTPMSSGSGHPVSLLGNFTTDAVTDGQSGGNPGFSQAEIDSMRAHGPGVTEGKAPTADNSLALDIVGHDVGYVATFQVGNPPRDFRLIMDSGSADFWIGSDDCVSEETGGSCGNRTFLSADKSSTFHRTDEPWEITYGSGHVTGVLVSDDISIAGLSLPGHQFGVASTESKDFASPNSKSDGLVGLGTSAGSNQRFLTPVEALAANGLIDEAITAYRISRIFDETNDGEITFGGVDESKFDASTLVAMDNLADNGFWVAPMDTVIVDNVDLGINRSVILDTGTTLLLVPLADAEAIHAAIDGAAPDGGGGFVLPCNTNATVALSFAGQAFNIASVDLAFLPLDLSNRTTGLCRSGIAASDSFGDGHWLAGDTFLKSVYLVTNVDKKQISLAKTI